MAVFPDQRVSCSSFKPKVLTQRCASVIGKRSSLDRSKCTMLGTEMQGGAHSLLAPHIRLSARMPAAKVGGRTHRARSQQQSFQHSLLLCRRVKQRDQLRSDHRHGSFRHGHHATTKRYLFFLKKSKRKWSVTRFIMTMP